MKIKIKLLFILSIIGCAAQAAEQSQLNRFIRAQEDTDKNTRLENKPEKKDVYSSVDTKAVTAITLPKEENCIAINKVVFENDFLDNTGIKKIKQQVSGRCLGVQGINKLASDVQDYFINSGYVTTRVEIPSQDLLTNTLVLRIAPGRIEKVIIPSNDVRDWVLPFKIGDILNIRDIEQGLEVLQNTPGMRVKIAIEPGTKDSYSNIVINTSRTKSWNARAWTNNWGDESTGRTLAGAAGYLYNLAKMNDVFYLSGSTNAQHVNGGYKSVSTYYSVPFGYWNVDLFYADSRSRQQIGERSLGLKYIGRNQYASVKGSRTVYRDADKKVALSAEILKRKVDYHLNEVELALQKRDMTNVKFGVNYKQNFPGAMLDTTLSYQRFVPWLGAEKTPDMKSGDVSTQSNIINLDTSFTKLLNTRPFDSYYELRSGIQYTPDALTLQDQYSLGNRWNVRGFENTAGIYGNKGFYVQNTLNVITGIKNIEWYLGADYGQILGDIYPEGVYANKKLLGGVTGFKGQLSFISYDVSLSTPVIYPHALDVDKLNVNFTLSAQL